MLFAVPKGCVGFQLEDGRKFDATPDGLVTVLNEDDIESIINCDNFKIGMIVIVKNFDRDKKPGAKHNYRVCDGCGRAPWDYQKVCSYCGSELPALES